MLLIILLIMLLIVYLVKKKYLQKKLIFPDNNNNNNNNIYFSLTLVGILIGCFYFFYYYYLKNNNKSINISIFAKENKINEDPDYYYYWTYKYNPKTINPNSLEYDFSFLENQALDNILLFIKMNLTDFFIYDHKLKMYFVDKILVILEKEHDLTEFKKKVMELDDLVETQFNDVKREHWTALELFYKRIGCTKPYLTKKIELEKNYTYFELMEHFLIKLEIFNWIASLRDYLIRKKL